MQTDICGADTCGFNIVVFCNVLTQSGAAINVLWEQWEQTLSVFHCSLSYHSRGRCWGYMYVPKQHKYTWFLWQLMKFPLEVKWGQNWQSTQQLDHKNIYSLNTNAGRVQSQTECIWSQAIKNHFKIKKQGKKQKSEREREECVYKEAGERL